MAERAATVKSGDPDFIHLVEQGLFFGSVHSVFERTLNIADATTGELYTIANHAVDNGPNTLVTELDRCSTLGLAAHDRVISENQCLIVEGKLEISVVGAEPWHAVLPAYPREQERLLANVQVAKRHIDAFGQNGGMLKSVAPVSSFEAETRRLLAERSSHLLAELAAGRWRDAIPSALGLVGLGPGLTPSGDDYLTGLFTAFNLPNSPLWSGRPFCSEVVAGASELTNPISFITMKKAADGQVRESIIRFVQAAVEGIPEETTERLAEVLRIGSSSGTEIALGLIHGLELNLEQRWR
ncbi:DUF2877 domain-containing protein [Cohnella soli]|uniref:DUF2877 domain-containing protein n=1 Tax=Cohnella soli TaxID=425005 RepID=A0ABW0HQC5_9BACL